MSILLNACNIYQKFLYQNYLLTLGYNNKEQSLIIVFPADEFRHLIGLQYLKDLVQLKTSAQSCFDKIKNTEISLSELQHSAYFQSHVATRLQNFVNVFDIFMSSILNNQIDFYRCNSFTVYPGRSKIVADYMLILNHKNQRFYLFLKECQLKNPTISYYTPISFFVQEQLDFVKDNTTINKMTLLHSISITAKTQFKHSRYNRKEYNLLSQIVMLNFS